MDKELAMMRIFFLGQEKGNADQKKKEGSDQAGKDNKRGREGIEMALTQDIKIENEVVNNHADNGQTANQVDIPEAVRRGLVHSYIV